MVFRLFQMRPHGAVKKIFHKIANFTGKTLIFIQHALRFPHKLAMEWRANY